MTNWARAGYVVIASNYRGGPRGEGHDEDGGADVDDVKALMPLARALPYADAGTLFLYGQSRGGMMVYRALAEGVPARAAVVNSGVADLDRADRPDAADMDAIAREAMPDYAGEKANHFCRRSAVCWPERITAPLLLLHGTADWRVSPAQVLDLAAKLQARRKPYALHIYEGGAHVWLDQDQSAIDREILAFCCGNSRLPLNLTLQPAPTSRTAMPIARSKAAPSAAIGCRSCSRATIATVGHGQSRRADAAALARRRRRYGGSPVTISRTKEAATAPPARSARDAAMPYCCRCRPQCRRPSFRPRVSWPRRCRAMLSGWSARRR